ncbi:MAG: CRISPR-associated protein Cas4 [Erysipelotrichaceae bacterium]
MENNEDDYLDIAGIQHFSFCKRQWALIHVEQEWSDNVLTAEGNIIHEKAHDNQIKEKRKNTLIVRGLEIKSSLIKAHGFCDVVEFHKDNSGITLHGKTELWIPYPVEYKRGKPKENDADRLQLCAQVICLEEMFDCIIDKGYLFYHETNRRETVRITDELRHVVVEYFVEMGLLYSRRFTPKVTTSKKCKVCSLKDICFPILNDPTSAEDYVMNRVLENNR